MPTCTTPALPKPNPYTPWLKGVYEVGPNLKPLGKERALQFDTLWPRIRANKELLLPGRVLRADLSESIAEAVVLHLAHRAAKEWPDLFEIDRSLSCRLTGEQVPLDAHGLDLLAMNLPCDVAVVRCEGPCDWNAYLHVSQPSHWRPEEKIGRSFVATHAAIPHFDKVNAAAAKLVQAMVSRGPWVRYVWGLETDDELDHHPDRAPGRAFATRPFVVRFERQVLIPLPEYGASIFLIGVGFASKDVVLADEALWRPLRTALEGMSPQARAYKGIAPEFEGLMSQFPPL